MSNHPIWPSGPSEIGLWAQLASVWIIAAYGIVPEQVDVESKGKTGAALARGVQRQHLLRLVFATLSTAICSALLPPAGSSSQVRLAVAVLPIAFVPFVIDVRSRLESQHRLRVTFELAVALLPGAATAFSVGLGQIGTRANYALGRDGKAAASLCVFAAVVFLVRGGTYIVRALLDQA